MDTDKLMESTRSLDIFGNLQQKQAGLALEQLIESAGCTSFEVTTDDLLAKNVSDITVSSLDTVVNIEGVTLSQSENGFYVSVDIDVYKHSKGLSDDNYFDIQDSGLFIYPSDIDMIRHAVKERMNVMFIGPSGSGKTDLAEILAKEQSDKYIITNMTGETTVDDIMGHQTLVDGDNGVITQFEPGPLRQALDNDIPLIIDEVDAATPEVLFAFQRVLEGKSIEVNGVSVETSGRGSGFFIIATANTCGRGDGAGLYRRQILDTAWRDRWDAVFRIPYISKNDEIRVLRKRYGMEIDTARRLATVACAARRLQGDRVVGILSTRKLGHVAKWVMAGYNIERAFKTSVTNNATDEDAVVFSELFNREFGKEIDLSDRQMEVE